MCGEKPGSVVLRLCRNTVRCYLSGLFDRLSPIELNGRRQHITIIKQVESTCVAEILADGVAGGDQAGR